MDPLDATGNVFLNAEGRRYMASYQLRFGVITVTCGATSRVVRVGGAVAFPDSLARTILRSMVKDNGFVGDLRGRRTHNH
jgi:hypothetical protein